MAVLNMVERPGGEGYAELPSALPAERTVLGAMLIDHDCIGEARVYLREEMFYSTQHRVLYRQMQQMDQARKPVDYISVSEEMGRTAAPMALVKRLGLERLHASHGAPDQAVTLLECVGGRSYLAEIEEDVLTTQNIGHYCRLIRVMWAKRSALELQGALHGDLMDRVTRSDFFARREKLLELLGIIAGDEDGGGNLPVFSPLELMALEIPEDIAILGDNVIARGELTLLLGPPDVGKSRLLNQFIFDLLAGREFWAEGVKLHRHDLRILLFQSENSAQRMRQDMQRQLAGLSREQWEWIDARFRFSLPLTVEGMLFGLDDSATARRMERTVREFDPDIVICDPLGDFYIGENENDAVQMRETVKTLLRVIKCQRMDVATILAHHARSGKEAASAALGWERGAFGRGSKALLSMARAQINIAPGDRDGGSVVIACGKNNNGRRFPPFAVQLNPSTMLYERIEDFDFEAWDAETGGKKKTGRRPAETNAAAVKFVARSRPTGMSHGELLSAVMDVDRCSASTAKRRINDALQIGAIELRGQLYFAQH